MSGRGRAGRVLVVDDEADLRGLLHELLSGDGHQVASAATPTEAISLAARTRPEVALVDVNLGAGADGLDLIPELHARRPGCRVVVVTACHDRDTLRRAAAAGVARVLVKPVDPIALLELVERLLAETAENAALQDVTPAPVDPRSFECRRP